SASSAWVCASAWSRSGGRADRYSSTSFPRAAWRRAVGIGFCSQWYKVLAPFQAAVFQCIVQKNTDQLISAVPSLLGDLIHAVHHFIPEAHRKCPVSVVSLRPFGS